MNQKLTEYIRRFQKELPKKNQSFFSQFSLKDYKSKLPYLFDIDIFCLKLYLALQTKQKICIYSDYDTDAVTATATMHWGLIDLGFNKELLSFYAPDRFTEGYGMNPEAITKLNQKYNLLISVDCGINSTEEASIVNKSNCDLIITDHHHLHGQVPEALAVNNPRLGKIYRDQEATKKNKLKKARNLKIKNLYAELKTNHLKIDKWLLEMDYLFQKALYGDANLMSESVTGVGVAWFCLVWFAYFLEEVDNQE